MKRVGYDSDTGRFYFRDRNGDTYAGPEGAEFGQMTRMSGSEVLSAPTDEETPDDLERAPAMARADGYQPLAVDITDYPHKPTVNTGAYRTLFPFFLIIAVVLLLIYRLILAPATSVQQSDCPGEDNMAYWVQPGDSCWSVAKAHGCSLEELMKGNPELDCEPLMPGTTVCLPQDGVAATSAAEGKPKPKEHIIR